MYLPVNIDKQCKFSGGYKTRPYKKTSKSFDFIGILMRLPCSRYYWVTLDDILTANEFSVRRERSRRENVQAVHDLSRYSSQQNRNLISEEYKKNLLRAF